MVAQRTVNPSPFGIGSSSLSRSTIKFVGGKVITEVKRKLIADIARVVKQRLNVSSPLNIKDFIENKLGGKVEEVSFDDSTIVSRITKDADTFVIEISKDCSEQELQLGKSLGHLLLHLKYLQDNKKKVYTNSPLYRQGYFEEDAEANEFALELLVPEVEFWTSYHSGNSTVKALQKLFDTSEHVVRVRLGEFGLVGGYY